VKRSEARAGHGGAMTVSKTDRRASFSIVLRLSTKRTFMPSRSAGCRTSRPRNSRKRPNRVVGKRRRIFPAPHSGMIERLLVIVRATPMTVRGSASDGSSSSLKTRQPPKRPTVTATRVFPAALGRHTGSTFRRGARLAAPPK